MMSNKTFATIVVMLLCVAVHAVPDRQSTSLSGSLRQSADSISRQRMTFFESRDMRHSLFTSSRPVEIRQQGRNLCVVSPTAQLLPVYTGRGTLYTAFHLSRGTNWLSGLPRGSYIINNKRFAIN